MSLTMIEKNESFEIKHCFRVLAVWGRLIDGGGVLERNQIAANQCVACRVFCNLEIKEIFHFTSEVF